MTAGRVPILITPEGHKKLKDELQWLWTKERPRVTQEVQTAAAHGDRSENAEYQYGKKRLREIDRRLRFLSKRLENVQVMGAAAQRRTDGRVGFGSWVQVEDEDGNVARYRIVGPDEFDPDRGLISVESPMGKALLGKEEGDEFEVHRPRGTATFTVVDVSYDGEI